MSRVVVLSDSALADRAVELLERVERRERDGGEFVRLEHAGSAEFFVKGGPLRGSGARRHGWARLLLRRPPPRLREYARLRELRRLRFHAPEPVLAAARVDGPRVLSQVLVTARVVGAAGYEALLASPPSAERSAALDALARTLARLHAVGFEHRDLYARNLLHVHHGDGVEPVLLDLWRGGRAHEWWRERVARAGRRAARDLARLFTDLARDLAPREQHRFLAAYLERARDLVPGFDAAGFEPRLARAYRRHAAFLRARPERLRGRPAPPAELAVLSDRGARA